MKKDNLKKTEKIVRKAKPSAKGAALKSKKKENSNIKIRNTKQIQNPEIQNKKQSFRSFEFNKFDIVSNFVLRASNLKHWHKISAAFVSIAIIGIVVFFQFAPENARSKTFTFLQTTWSSVLATAVHNPDGSDQTAITTYASKDTQISVTPDTAVTLAATTGSKQQTNDGTTATGFKLSGYATSGTVVAGSGDSANIKLATYGGTEANGVLVYCDASGTTFDGSNCTYTSGTAYNLTANIYNFTDFKIEDGVTVTVTVNGSNALKISATGNVKINGILQANGGNASSGVAGVAGAGGSAGGNGGGFLSNGSAGAGTCSGGGGLVDYDNGYQESEGGGGGGGGFGGVGSTGRVRFTAGDGGGVGGNNTCSLGDINGGSGGGGGGGGGLFSGTAGGGGGGGGGAIKIISAGTVTIGSSGKITANGGNGGLNETSADSWGGGGGGGSGGGVYVEAMTVVNSNATDGIQAKGGGGYGVSPIGGGNGGGGRIDLHAVTSAPSTTGSTAVAGTSGYGTANAGTVIANTTTANFPTSGIQTYTSGVIDTGQASDFTTISWTETLNSQTLTMKVRSCDDSACSGETAFGSISQNVCTSGCTIGQGGNLNSLSSVVDGHRYIQYQAALSTTNTAVTPSLDDITFNYQYYPTGTDYKLLSSEYNSGDNTNLVTNISWNENVPTGTDVKFQVRTAPDSGGSADWTNGSKWCGPSSCAATAGATDYANSYHNTTPAGEFLKGDHSTGDNDRWIQYIAFLSTTDSTQKPTLSDVTLTYVINSPPVVSSVSASAQDSTGKSTIQYTIYDGEEGNVDNRLEAYYFYDVGTTLSGSLAASATGTITLTNSTVGILDKISTTGYLLIDNEVVQYDTRSAISGAGPYTATVNIVTGGRGKWVSGTAGYTTKDVAHNSGVAVWVPIPDSALSGATSPSLHIACSASATCASVGDANTYSVAWDPNNHFDGLYKTGVKARVAVNDKNAANQMSTGAGGESSAVTIDTKDPVLAGISFSVKDASDDSISVTDSRTVKLTVSGITDNSNIELQFSNDGANWGSATNSSGAISNTGWTTGLDPAQTYTNTSWVLPTGNGSKTVYVRVRDQYGNPSATPSSAANASTSYNITPEFNSAYDAGSGYTCDSTGADGICIRQLRVADDANNAGKVEIKYQVRDQDTDESFVPPNAGNVNVYFQYTINGTDWNAVANNLSGDGSDNGTTGSALNRLVDLDANRTTYKTHTNYWDAKTAGIAALDDDYIGSQNFKIRAYVADGEAVNGTSNALASDGINIDTKNPATVSVTIVGGATTDSRDATLTLAAADDSNVQVQYANDANNNSAADDAFAPAKTDLNNDGTVITNSGNYTSADAVASFTSALWRLNKGVSTTKRVYFKVRDIYGNTTTVSDTIDYNQTPEFDGTFGTNGIDVYQCQITDSTPCDVGKVRVQYRIRDKDKLDGAANQSTVTAAIKYLNGTYQNTTTLSGDTGNLAVETTNSGYNTYNPAYKTFTTYWNAKTDFDGYFQNGTARIQIVIDDGETASNTATATSALYTLDTKNPTLGASPFLVNSNNQFTSIRAVTLNLSATEDSTYYAQYSNDNSTFGAGSDTLGALDSSGSTATQVTGKYEAYGASKAWNLPTPTLASNIDASTATIPLSSSANLPTSGWILIDSERISYSGISGNSLIGASRGQADTTAASHTSGTAVEVDGPRTVYNKIFDIYGNGLALSRSDGIYYDQTPAGTVKKVSIQDASNTQTSNWRLFLSWESLSGSQASDFKQYKVFRCKTGILTDTNCPVVLSSDINSSVDTIPVNSTATLPSSGTVDIDGELIAYAGKTSSTLTGATRGANSTTAASHLSGAQVYSFLTNNTAQAAVLSGDIDLSQTTGIALNSVNGFASSGSVLIDSEVITYTSLTGTTLSGTVTRAAKGTTAAAHSSGAQAQSLNANLSTNYFTDDFSSTDSGNANPNQTKYFYFIRSEDLAGNVAPKSSIVSSVPNGSGGRDTIPVRVYDGASNCSANSNTATGLACSAIGTNTATVAWKTHNTTEDTNTGDQDIGKGDSFVEYGTVSGTYTKSAGLHNYVTDHSIQITGLTPNTTYYFRVRTRDGIGNIDTTKTDGTGGISLERSFTTRDIDTPTSVSAAPSKNGSTITWLTIDQTNSLIEYWKLSEQTTQTTTCNYSNIALNKVKVAGTENEAVTSHSVSISQKLSTSSDYCFRIRSKDTNNNNITGSAVKFTTLGVPTISNARADSADIQTNTAIVKWSTSDNTTSYLEFWKTGTSSKKTAGGDTLATAHSVQLPDDLLTNTKYYFQIKSKDDSDNAITSSNANCAQADGGGCYFTTNAPPAPGAISVANVGMNKAEISWTTTGGNDSKTNSIAEYVNYDDYNNNSPLLTVWKTAGSDAQAATHNVALPTELAAGAKYFVRVRTRDGKGNSVSNTASADTCPIGEGFGFDATIGECFFTTKIAPVISQVRVAEALKDKFTITWTTDAAATSIVEYGQNNTYGAIAGDDKTEAISHSVTVDGLTQKTAYHFKVRSFGNTAINQQATKVANLSETNDFTAETAIDPGDITAPVISQAAVGDTGSASAVITWITDEPADSQVFYTSSNPQTALLNSKHETRNTKQIKNSNDQNSKHLVLGISDFQTKVAHAASDQVVNSQKSKVNSFAFTARLFLSRSLAWTANHMPQVSLVVSFILGAVFAVFAALLLVMANYMRGGWRLRQILKMTPMIVLKDTSSGFCALANSDNQGTWQASFSVYSKHRNVTRKTIGTALALGVLKIFLSTSIPVFLLTQASLAAVNYSSTVLDPAKNTTHRVELAGLNPATTYWIYVSSADAKGNSANTIANPLPLTTETAPDETAPVISNIQITGITDSEVVISWETNESGDSFVEYGTDVNYGSTSGQEEGNTSHSVKLTGLKGNTAYHFKTKSKDISGNIGQSIDQSFNTSAGPTNIPPKISAEGPRVEDLKPISAKILWKTDKPSSSIVAFGKNTDYGTEIGNTEELITEHEVQLFGLDPDTKYRFKVKSADADGNIGESPDKEFATPAKAVISKVAASEISMTSAIITWETSTSITSEIEYGKTVAYGKNIIDKSLSQTTQHTVKIDGLESGVQYHFRAKGTDQYGSIVQSDDYAFSTIAEPKIAKFEIESVTHGGATIVWETNTNTDSLVEYQKDGDAEAKTAGATDLAKNHKIKIDKLDDNSKFRVRILGRDTFGNEVKSDYKEFLTLADTEAPKIASVKTESSMPSAGENQVQVLVSWTTDEPATTQVEYRQGVAIGKNYPSKSRLDTNHTTSHLAVLSGFKTSDIYHFRVVSKDRAGNEGASADYTILTPQKKESLLQIILKNLEESFGFLRKLGK